HGVRARSAHGASVPAGAPEASPGARGVRHSRDRAAADLPGAGVARRVRRPLPFVLAHGPAVGAVPRWKHELASSLVRGVPAALLAGGTAVLPVVARRRFAACPSDAGALLLRPRHLPRRSSAG